MTTPDGPVDLMAALRKSVEAAKNGDRQDATPRPPAPPTCSFCKRPPRWNVEGSNFRVQGCASHAHRALDVALMAGNATTKVTSL